MPELPEITHLARQIDQHLKDRTIAAIDVLQPKCLNLPVEAFQQSLQAAQICGAANHGKWIQIETTRGWLLFNLGMGGEIRLVYRAAALPEKRRLVFAFADGASLSVNFWWFGYAHYAAPGQLERHEMSARLGPNALDLSAAGFKDRLSGQRGKIKTFLLDQSRLAGIGNAYIHDILFLAHLHPDRKIDSLSPAEVDGLFEAIQQGLRPSLEKGGAFYETDLFGKNGGFTMADILIGYKEGQPCPVCATPVQKIKTGSTSSFICPQCQPA